MSANAAPQLPQGITAVDLIDDEQRPLAYIGYRSRAIAVDREWDTPIARCDGPGQVNVRSKSAFEDTALIGTEVSEALECLRIVDDPQRGYTEVDGKPEGFASELADVVIRACEVAAKYGLDLDVVVEQKIAYNARRPVRHGGKAL